MNFSKQILWIALLVTALLLSRPASQAATQLAAAQQSEKSAPIKWEYCAINAVYSAREFGRGSGKAVVHHFLTSGIKEEIIELSPDIGRKYGDLEQEVLAKAIAKLGEDGWEMIAKEPSRENNTINVFYFKRPKS